MLWRLFVKGTVFMIQKSKETHYFNYSIQHKSFGEWDLSFDRTVEIQLS